MEGDESGSTYGVPNQITASGLRRAEATIPEDEMHDSAGGHIKVHSAVCEDFPDEKELRRRTGEEKLFRDYGDKQRKLHSVFPCDSEAHREDKTSTGVRDRRPGYGTERA
jgi:hypothetical protein